MLPHKFHLRYAAFEKIAIKQKKGHPVYSAWLCGTHSKHMQCNWHTWWPHPYSSKILPLHWMIVRQSARTCQCVCNAHQLHLEIKTILVTDSCYALLFENKRGGTAHLQRNAHLRRNRASAATNEIS